jgi:hypothetical protein
MKREKPMSYQCDMELGQRTSGMESGNAQEWGQLEVMQHFAMKRLPSCEEP